LLRLAFLEALVVKMERGKSGTMLEGGLHVEEWMDAGSWTKDWGKFPAGELVLIKVTSVVVGYGELLWVDI